MNALLRDLRYAVRSLARTPVFTLGIVATLALGLGANATMFGVVDTLFLKPPAGVRDADQVVRVYFRRESGGEAYTGATTGYPTFADLRDNVPALVSVAAIAPQGFSLGRGADAEQVTGAAVSYQYFDMLGVTPALGRFFTADEDKVGGARVAVISHSYWQRKFRGNASVLGRPLLIGRSAYTVIGVTEAGFGGIDIEPAGIFLPIAVSSPEGVAPNVITSRGWFWMRIVARLAPGATREVAQQQITAAYRHGMTAGGEPDSTTVGVLGPIQEARGPEADDESKVSAWIGFVALAVLLIACANVANLLLARANGRRRELAVRAGLGAGRRGLVRMLLSESLVLAAVGGGAALLLALWFGSLLRAVLLPDLPADAVLVDQRVLMFTALTVIATTLLAGLVPAFQASRTDLSEALKAGGHGSTARIGRTRSVLLGLQVAMTLVLLVGAGLFVRSLRNVQHIETGFDGDRVVALSMNLDALGTPRAANTQTYLRLMERIQNLAGVEYASASMGTPMGWSYAATIEAEGVDSLPSGLDGGPYYHGVTSDYFRAMGMRLVRGRDFGSGDVEGAPKVAIVNETFARRVWPGQDAVGKCLYFGEDADPAHRRCSQVVGVVENATRGRITEVESFQYYLPLSQIPNPRVNALMIRSRTRAADIAGALVREVHASGGLPYARIRSLEEIERPQMRSWRLGAMAFSAFGLLALLIAATGVVAVLSYSVSQRTQEIGVRVALGAQAGQVVRLIVAQGLKAMVAGMLIGGVGAYALGRAMAALLYEVAPSDPLVYAGVALTLLVVAMVAAWLPARRAARVDPMVALRSE